MNKRQQIVHTLSRHFTRGDIQGATDELLSLFDVVKSLPNDDEIEQAANEEATRIFDGTGNGSEWYARHHGFMDGVEWVKNHLTK